MIVAAGVGGLMMLTVATWGVVRMVRPKPDETVASTPAQPLTGEQVYQRLLRSGALIQSKDGHGSGFVVDVSQKLVVTNFHVVRGERTVDVVFPIYDAKEELVTDAGEYKRRIREVAVKGDVLVSEVGCDLALIRVERLPEKVSAAPLAGQHASTGTKVYSVGGSGVSDNLLWRLTEGSVRGRAQRRAEADFGVVDCMILESSAPVNPGDSGGPVMNERGEIVGVVSHFNTRARQVSGNIDVDELRKFMSRHAGVAKGDKVAPPAPSNPAPVPPAPVSTVPTDPASNNKGKIEGTRWTSIATTINGRPLPADALKLEFTATGRLAYEAGPKTFRGVYSLGSGDTVTFDLDEDLGGSRTHIQKIVIRGTQLALIDLDGTTINFRKLK